MVKRKLFSWGEECRQDFYFLPKSPGPPLICDNVHLLPGIEKQGWNSIILEFFVGKKKLLRIRLS